MEKTSSTELLRVIKFTLFSISAGVIEFASFALMYNALHIVYWISYLVALILSIIWNFTLNRRYTFRSAANVPIAMLKVFGFYCVFTPVTTFGGNYLEVTLGMNGNLVTLINMALNLITEYLFFKYVVFRNNIDTNYLAKK
ncbi:MAG: GtrA family protein [Desulfotomaculaceae bacterium]|nr:GtrA family protein [Desulfotomaculaceae bacterium]